MAIQHVWVGAVDEDSARVVGQSTGSSVRLAVDTDSGFGSPTYFGGPETPDADDMVSFTATSLSSDTLYYFALEEDSVLDTDFSGKFKTHGTAGQAYSFTFGASSCAGNSLDDEQGNPSGYITDRVSNRPIFETIAADDDLQFFIHLGDLHYKDITSGLLADHRQAYDDTLTYNETLTSDASQGILYRQIPLVYIWDDHDYSDNNSDGTYSGKANAAAAYRERVPHYTLAESSAIYHEFTVGRVQFIMTDSRYYRDLTGTPTMLGATQMAWIENLLDTSTAEFLVFCTQDQWHTGGSDAWPGFTSERQDLADLFDTYGWTDRMIMLVGDGHSLGMESGETYNSSLGGFPVYQFSALDSGGGTSSGDYDIVHTAGRDRWGKVTITDNGSVITCEARGMISDTIRATHTTTVVTDTVAPTTPTNLAVTDETDHTISLSWTASTDAVQLVGYRVFRDGNEVGATSLTTYTDSGLSLNTTYTYTVKAYDLAGNLSAASDSVQGTTDMGSAAMAWPNTILPLYVEMNIGGTWTDITADVRQSDGIQITRGAANEAGTLEPGRAVIKLENINGKYSPRNVASPYYGLLGRNTPVRIWAHGPTGHLLIQEDETRRARVANDASLDITTDMEIQVECALDAIPYQDTDTYFPAEQEVVARYNVTGDERSWALLIGAEGRPILLWSEDGTSANTLEADCPTHLPYSAGQRFALKATLDVNNGAGGYTVTFYHARTVNDTWQQLGAPIVGDATTNIFNSEADLDLGDVENLIYGRGAGRYYSFKLLDGIGGTALVDADFTNLSDGTTSFTDNASQDWVFTNCDTTHLHQRFYGEVANWPMEWDVGGFDVTTSVVASGVLRRLGQGSKPIQSALRRSIENYEVTPVAYWHLEDGVDSDSGGTGVDGVINLATSGFQFRGSTNVPGSDDCVALGDSSQMSGKTFNAVDGNWQFEFIYKLDSLPSTEQLFMEYHFSGGTFDKLSMYISSSAWRIFAADSDDNTIINFQTTSAFTLGLLAGQWNRLQLWSVTDDPTSADVRVAMAVESSVENFWGWTSTTYVGEAGAPAGISGRWGSDFQGMGLGHIAIWDGKISPTTSAADGRFSYAAEAFVGADSGYAGERAAIRIGRLASETETRIVPVGRSQETTRMGQQTVGTLLDNLQQVVDADIGRMIEFRHLPSLCFRPRISLYNQPSYMTLDYEVSGEIAMPFAPVEDDQALRNDITVTREGGSEGTAVLETGRLSIQDPPTGVGRYTEARTLALYRNDDAHQTAHWLLHLGTWDEARFPSVSMDLRMAPQDRTDEWINFEVGDVFTIVNPPPWMPPDDIHLRMEGYTETLNAFEWNVTMNCTPADPYLVGIANDSILGHADTAGTQLQEDLDTTETAVHVMTTDGPPWTTDSNNMPFNVRVGGEVMAVTAISDSAAADTSDSFDRSNSTTNLGSTDGGTVQAWTQDAGTWGINGNAAYISAAANSMATVAGMADFEFLEVTMSTWGSGEGYLMFRFDDTSNRMRWGQNVGSAAQLQVISGGSVTATYVSGHILSQGDTLGVRAVGSRIDLFVNGDLKLTVEEETNLTNTRVGLQTASTNPRFNDFELNTGQTMTVTRSVNEVVKTHSTGASLSLETPARVALGE